MLSWTRPFVPLAVFVAAFGGAAACSSSGGGTSPTTAASSSATTAAPATAAAVTIKNFSFSPTPITVKAGQAVTVTNQDTTDHTFTDSGGAFDTGHIAPGTSKTVTLAKAGTYHYHCNIHPTMTGEIDVSG